MVATFPPHGRDDEVDRGGHGRLTRAPCRHDLEVVVEIRHELSIADHDGDSVDESRRPIDIDVVAEFAARPRRYEDGTHRLPHGRGKWPHHHFVRARIPLVGGAREEGEKPGVHPAPRDPLAQVRSERLAERHVGQHRPKIVEAGNEVPARHLGRERQHALPVGEVLIQGADGHLSPSRDSLHGHRSRTAYRRLFEDGLDDRELPVRIEPTERTRDQALVLERDDLCEKESGLFPVQCVNHGS